MRSTTLFVWAVAALVACAWILPGSTALAQGGWQFDGGVGGQFVTCIDWPGDGVDVIINAIEDSLELSIILACPDANTDDIKVVFNPYSGLGTIPSVVQSYPCPTGPIVGHRMNTSVEHGKNINGGDDLLWARITATYRFRPEGLCVAPNSPVSFSIGARGMNTAIDTLCMQRNYPNGEYPTVAIPCSVCTGCGYVLYEENCGFREDGIIAIGDRVYFDSTNITGLDGLLSRNHTWDHDTLFVYTRRLTCGPAVVLRDTIMIEGDTVTIAECNRENAINCDTIWISIGYWDGSTAIPAAFDCTVVRYTFCIRPVDNVRPQVVAGMVDSFRILNGNAIWNDSLVGCCDTLRIYMATDSLLVGGAYPFNGDVDGTPITTSCGSVRRHNFDMSWIGLWFGDLMGESRETDTSGYIHNSEDKGLLCPADTFLWMSNRFSWTAPDNNNLMWIDIPFCSADWDSLQICLLESGQGLQIGEDTLFLWGFDDAGNRSNRIPWADTSLCIDVWPPEAELGSDILLDGRCVNRFSPYDSADVAHMYTNLSPDSIEWIKCGVDTNYNADSMLSVFNDVYMIGFDVRVMPLDTAPITKLNYVHPKAPIPMDPTLDTLRWLWTVDTQDDICALFRWWGKRGTDSIDAVLGTSDLFWKCASGGGLTVGITFARWMDAAGCNKILGWDYDGSTNISQNYTTRNQLRAVVDMCIPGVVVLGLDELTCTNLDSNSGGDYNLPGPDPIVPTYLWVGPNGGQDSLNPVLRFRPKRNFAEDTTFDECLVEDTLFYRIRVDSVDLISALGAWPGVNDSVRWYSRADSTDGTGNPGALWTPILFNAGDVNGPEISFHWGHKFGAGGNDYLPDGLYRLMLELRDDAGNVYRDPIYIWLNGAGPAIDSIEVCNTDSVCTYNFYTTNTQDTLCIWLQTDTTADQVLIDWTCVYNIAAHSDSDTTYAELVDSTSTYKQWFGYLIITPDMVSVYDSLNIYEIAPRESDLSPCNIGTGGRRIINVRPLDISALGDTIYSQADPQHDCDKAAIGLTPCPRILTDGDYPSYDRLFSFVDPDRLDTLPPGTFRWQFGDGPDSCHAISPGKIDSMGGAGTYNAVFNWANDQVQDSIFVRLLLDSISIRPDTLDTLIVQFINLNYSPPRVREVRKGLFRPACVELNGDPGCGDVWNNQIDNVGRLERDSSNKAWVEYRYYWNGTWFRNAGVDSLMLVPYDQQDTILVKAFVQAVDTIIQGDTTYNTCPDTLYAWLDVDNINPHFRSGWTGWNNPGHDPVTGSSKTVKNLGWDADGDGDAEDCGFRFSDGEHFRLKVKLTEKVHEFDQSYFPDTSGSHHNASGFWPLTRNWQISPIDLRTGDIFSFGSTAAWDSCKVVLDSVLVDSVRADSVYYTLFGYFDFPPAAITYFASNPNPVDSVAMVIRAAWDEAGNPGRYNNPVFNDGLRNDASEDTTFFVTLTSPSPWTGDCPLVYGRVDSVLGWITAEEDDVVVRTTIIETSEIGTCAPGVYADSINVLEGNFQTITDDPNPWVIPDLRGPWFLYIVGPDTLGWARTYTWYLRADMSDQATIHCDGDTLPFILRFNTYAIPWPLNTRTFDECVQVDVNEPTWERYVYDDSTGAPLPGCFDPRQSVTIVAQLSDAYGDPVSCGYSPGVGVDTTMIWADLSCVLGYNTNCVPGQGTAMDSVRPDSVVGDIAYWTFTPADTFACIDSASAWIRLYALHDSLHHHDRELFFQDTLYFCSDCWPPYIQAVNAFCECDTALDFAVSSDSCTQLPLNYLSPNSWVSTVLCVGDVDGDSSSGIDPNSIKADLSWINSAEGWVSADSITGEGTLVKALFGICLQPVRMMSYMLTEEFGNGDTIYMRFRFCDNFGNCDTDTVAIAIMDTLPPIVDSVYTIGDDSIRAYVTPGDHHVHISADLTGYDNDLVSAPEHVWADLSNLWCDAPHKARYDTVYAHHVDSLGPNHYRAYWGWYPRPWSTWDSLHSFRVGDPILGDSLVPGSDTLGTSDTLCRCANLGAEGFFDTLRVHVTDLACNVGSGFSVFELSGCDSTVPAVDHVEIRGNGCGEGWISSMPLDSGHIEVWAFMDTLIFNGLEDTLLIDSMQANLAQLGPDYAWTQWSSDLKGGAPVYGTVPDPSQLVQTYWEKVDGWLVAKWVFLTARNLGCEDSIVVGVKAIRSTGSPGSYYTDVEYGMARVDTTR
ncbi:MAG: hypothetical protein NT025_04135, partial [bacterium]|nr:hypothetical protein [bacterium]